MSTKPIRISDETYKILENNRVGFETPAQVLDKLLANRECLLRMIDEGKLNYIKEPVMTTERRMTTEEISALNLPIQVTREELLQIASDMRNPDLPNDESPTLIKVVDRSLSK